MLTSPPSSRDRAVKLARWLLLLPPCLPGALMLLAGWARVQPRFAPARLPALLAYQQAGELYTAGQVALSGGVVMAALIAWKILRPAPLEEETRTLRPTH